MAEYYPSYLDVCRVCVCVPVGLWEMWGWALDKEKGGGESQRSKKWKFSDKLSRLKMLTRGHIE